jgi:hypothetical protein
VGTGATGSVRGLVAAAKGVSIGKKRFWHRGIRVIWTAIGTPTEGLAMGDPRWIPRCIDRARPGNLLGTFDIKWNRGRSDDNCKKRRQYMHKLAAACCPRCRQGMITDRERV